MVKQEVTTADTVNFVRRDKLILMVAKKKSAPRKFWLREWREFMGAKAVHLADAAGVERESYYRLEREPFRLSLPQIESLADELGIRPDQFWFKPPAKDADVGLNLNDLIEDAPANVQAMVIKAVRGMVGK